MYPPTKADLTHRLSSKFSLISPHSKVPPSPLCEIPSSTTTYIYLNGRCACCKSVVASVSATEELWKSIDPCRLQVYPILALNSFEFLLGRGANYQWRYTIIIFYQRKKKNFQVLIILLIPNRKLYGFSCASFIDLYLSIQSFGSLKPFQLNLAYYYFPPCPPVLRQHSGVARSKS